MLKSSRLCEHVNILTSSAPEIREDYGVGAHTTCHRCSDSNFKHKEIAKMHVAKSLERQNHNIKVRNENNVKIFTLTRQ